MTSIPVTLVEVAPFSARAREIWDEPDIEAFKDFIARNPTAGAVIPGTGGVRKIRWSASGRGKRGGARVVYYFHSDDVPLFLLTAYPMNAAEDLTPRQRQAISRAVTMLVEHYRRN